jgi:nucleoside-triphosphatase
MREVLLLTGAPGSGKTTAIRKVVRQLERPTGGFYTQEIREGGRRVGFRIHTLDGREGILAHVQILGSPRVSKYGVDLEAIQELAVASVRRALDREQLVVVDEIGPMEVLSDAFRDVVRAMLEVDVSVLGSITRKSGGFFGEVKAHPRVRLIEITPKNREQIVERVLKVLQ